MARAAHISNQQILDSAREVFLEQGIQATTAEVARKAGIAEGSIFKRFPTKQELFVAAMQPTFADPAFLQNLRELVGKGDIRKHLEALGAEAIELFRQVVPLMIMSWSNREAANHPLQQDHPPPIQAIKRLAGYFEAEMHLGRLRMHDPQIMARVFVGSVQNFVLLELLSLANEELPMSSEVYLHGVIELVWKGVAPRVKKRTKR
jgi:AcrR family transcriptional regulator